MMVAHKNLMPHPHPPVGGHGQAFDGKFRVGPNNAQQAVGLDADNADGTVAAPGQERVLVELDHRVDRFRVAREPEVISRGGTLV